MTRRAGVVFLLLITGACATPSAEPSGGPPDEPPYIEGAVTEVSASPQGGRVMVEEAGEGGNEAAVTVTAETVVVQEFGGGYEPSDLSQLRPGLSVAVWTTQPVRQSFPVQIVASGIVIRER